MINSSVLHRTAYAVILVCFTSAGISAENEPSRIEWLTNPEAAIKASRQTGRPTLVFFTTSDCVFCRKMERETWQDETVVKTVRAAHVPLQIDGQIHRKIAQRLKITAFPTTMLVSPDGQLVGRFEGFLKPDEFLNRLEREQTEFARASGSTK